MKRIVLLALFSFAAVLAMSGIPSASHAPPSSPPTGCGLLPTGLAHNITASAPWYCPINGQVYAAWQNDLPIAALAILFSFMVASLIFIVGISLKSDPIRNFGLGELYEAIASTFIVFFFLFICAVMFGLIPSVVVGGINPYATAFNLITSTISQAQGLYNAMYQVVLTDSFYISPSVTLYIGGIDYSSFVGYAIAAATIPIQLYLILPATTIGQLIIDGVAALYVQYYLIAFFAVASIPAFIVPGVVLRAILPTRALGGMLLAIGIGFYLVMPTLFAVAYYFTSPTLLHALQGSQSQLARWGAGTGAETGALSTSSPLVLALADVQSALSSFWLLVLFYPALIIAMTYAFITQLANFIGGASRTQGKIRALI